MTFPPIARTEPVHFSHRLILILAGVVLWALPVSAGKAGQQDGGLITLDARNRSIKAILHEIEQKTRYRFIYESDKVDASKRTHITVSSRDIRHVLDLLLKKEGLGYTVTETDLILIYPADKTGSATEAAADTGIRVVGTVTDPDGNPMEGVNIHVKNTSTGTVTAPDGSYTLSVPGPDAVLVFSFVGFLGEELAVRGPGRHDMVMQPVTFNFNELVVVGYGEMERRSLTNAVARIGNHEFMSGSSSPLMAIQDRVPGLSIIQTNGSGDPNTQYSIQLRGVNSIKAEQAPLLVIDGVPGAEIHMVAKEDIESITILKDASAAAIYGTRASGGVILITTKRAQAGRLKVNFTSELSWESLTNLPEVMSAGEFRRAGKAAGYDFGGSTDWVREVTRNGAFTHRYAVSASGGSDNARVMASAHARNSTGTLLGADRRELGGRVNTWFNLFGGRLEVTANASYTDISASLSEQDIYEKALQANPTYPVHDPTDPSGYFILLNTAQMYNPVAEAKLQERRLEKSLLLANSTVKLKLTRHWDASLLLGVKSIDEEVHYYRSALHRLSREGEPGNRGYAELTTARSLDKTLDLTTGYRRQMGKHYINAAGGYTYQEFNSRRFGAGNSGFLVDGPGAWGLGDGEALSDGNASMDSHKDPRIKLAAFFGRVNYDYRNRYMVTATLRYEGSSKFYRNNWGLFPGISAGWRLSSEPFMASAAWLNDLKVRASYGQTGNAGFSVDRAFRLYNAGGWTYVDGRWIRVYRVAYNQNPDLKWEVKKEIDIGLDFSVLDNRLSARLDWYRRRVNDLLYSGVPVASPPAVYSDTEANVGTLANSGLEIELNWRAVRRPGFDYSVAVSGSVAGVSRLTIKGSTARMELHQLPHPGSPGAAVLIGGGQDIGKFWLWKYAGTDAAGTPLIYDSSGSKIPYDERTAEDRRLLGRAIPRAVVSTMHTFRLRDWDLTLYFRSWLGYDIFNVRNMYLGVNTSFSAGRNVLRSAGSGTGAAPKYDGRLMTDHWLEKGNFLKLDNITLGYTLPKGKVKFIGAMRVFATVRNVFTVTGYRGTDPEVNVNGLEPGFGDLNEYPRSRTIMTGITIGF